MPCLVALLAMFFPRLVLILLFIFSTYLHDAYQTVIWPVLGFLFFPFTTLAYAWAINSNGSVTGLYALVLVFAVLCDLGSTGGGGYAGSRHTGRR